jgi:hypothetical protein
MTYEVSPCSVCTGLSRCGRHHKGFAGDGDASVALLAAGCGGFGDSPTTGASRSQNPVQEA